MDGTLRWQIWRGSVAVALPAWIGRGFEAHAYFGPDARTRIAAANAPVPGGYPAFSEGARRNMKPGG